LAPNWLGDLVMALPTIADARRTWPTATVSVAARASVAGLLPFIPDIDGTVSFEPGASLAAQARVLAEGRFETAVLLPNSFRVAWLVWRAGIRDRWGYRADGRSWLLTRAIPRPAPPFRQVDYYQHLGHALGMETGPALPRLAVPPAVPASAKTVLHEHGYDGQKRLVVIAPGAAYGTAKQWIPAHVATLVAQLAREDVTPVLIGSKADAGTAALIAASLPPDAKARAINLVGLTSLEMLVGVLQNADVVVGNDSGAMHLAAGLGTRVVAAYGPTNEHHSPPLAHPDHPAVVLTHPVWCRPCMLAECPIDHACMTGIGPERVHAAVVALLNRDRL
jgi:heptosyltransferase-2